MHSQGNVCRTQVCTTLSERFIEVPPHPLVVWVIRRIKMCVRCVVVVLQAIGAVILLVLLLGIYLGVPLAVLYGAMWLLAFIVRSIWQVLF